MRFYSGEVQGFEQITERLLVGIDLLAIALVVFAGFQPAGPAWLTWLAVVVFLAVYAIGRHRVSVIRSPMSARGAWWPGQAWALALIIAFVGLLLTSTGAMWLAFPLMLLELHILGPIKGLLAVGVTTACAVLLGATLRGSVGVGYVIGPAFGAVVALGIVAALEALTRVVAEKDAALVELEATRGRLAAAETERAVATERTRLARDIHDTLAQDFSAIGLHLRAAEAQLDADSGALVSLRAAQQTAGDGLAESRRVVGELVRDSTEGSLEATLERVVAKASASGGPVIDFRVSGPSRPLPTEVATAVVRVTQSALANVVQHARARTAEVHLAYDDREVVLDVVDDGVGFEPATVPSGNPAQGGFGLPVMRARAAELGGSLTIESGAGDGTALALALPIRGLV